MRTLRILDSPVEAEILKSRLDAAGILAVVNGGEVGTMLSHIGTAAVRVRVEVAPEDLERAEAILEEDALERTERTAWRCSRCDEPNEPLFDMCWACGKQRTNSDSLGEGDAERYFEDDDVSDPFPEPENPADEPTTALSSDNPYAPPRVAASGVILPASDPGREPDAKTEETVSRVFRGAVFGTVIIPPLLSMYVLGMLVTTVPRSAYQAPRLRRKLMISWTLCILSLLFATVLVASYL